METIPRRVYQKKEYPRIFIGKGNINFPYCIISGSDIGYIKNVLRLKKEDKIIVLDGSNKEYLTKIQSISRDKINCKILNENIVEDKINIDITLAQAIPKHKKMDLIVEKATELGVARIIPVVTERTIANISSNKIERLKRIAKESAEQCGRYKIPLINHISDLDTVLKEIKNYDLAIMPWELEREVSIKDILKNNIAGKNKIIVIIGPEGGFSLTEINKARDNNIMVVSLGKLILRVETACLSTLSIINYEFGEVR